MPASGVELYYGVDQVWRPSWPEGVRLIDRSQPVGTPLDDVAAAVLQAIRAPVEGPSLGVCVVPGDAVTLALDAGLPQAATILGVVVGELLAHGVRAQDLTVLADRETRLPPEQLAQQLPPGVADAWTWIEHDPARSEDHGFLGASQQGERIDLHRALLDADFVLPLGGVRFDADLGYHAGASCLYPWFSTEATQQRFRRAASGDVSGQSRPRAWSEIDEVGHLLGTLVVLQVLPGGTGPRGPQVLDVWLSSPTDARPRAQQQQDRAWRLELDEPVPLLIAGLDGPPEVQSWGNLARVLAAARRVIEPGGHLVICSDLGLKGQEGADPLDATSGHGDRAGLARQVAAASQEAHVYLLSRLEPAVVDDLNLVPIQRTGEIENLLAGLGVERCLLLGSAHRMLPEIRNR